MFVDGEEGSPTYEETNKRSWYGDNIGSKWCYLEEYDDDYLFGRSAWAAPDDGLHWLAKQLGKLDPELIMWVTFEDEMPNFVGWAVFYGIDLWEDEIANDEEFRNIVSKYSPDTNLDDEDDYYEALWESIYNWQKKNFNRVEKEIINSKELVKTLK